MNQIKESRPAVDRFYSSAIMKIFCLFIVLDAFFNLGFRVMHFKAYPYLSTYVLLYLAAISSGVAIWKKRRWGYTVIVLVYFFMIVMAYELYLNTLRTNRIMQGSTDIFLQGSIRELWSLIPNLIAAVVAVYFDSKIDRIEHSMPDIKSSGDSRPWVKIWTQQRTALKSVFNNHNEWYLIMICVVGGIAEFYNNSLKEFSAGASLLSTIPRAFLVGLIGGIIYLYFASMMLRWVGSWLGGKARSSELRIAVAWARLPIILLGGIILGILSLRPYLINLPKPIGLMLVVVVVIATLMLRVWEVFILSNGIAEAQGWLVRKAVLNIVMVFVFLIVVYIVFTLAKSVAYLF